MTLFKWLSWCQFNNIGGWGRDNVWILQLTPRERRNWRTEFEWHLQNPKPKDRPSDDTALVLGA